MFLLDFKIESPLVCLKVWQVEQWLNINKKLQFRVFLKPIVLLFTAFGCIAMFILFIDFVPLVYRAKTGVSGYKTFSMEYLAWAISSMSISTRLFAWLNHIFVYFLFAKGSFGSVPDWVNLGQGHGRVIKIWFAFGWGDFQFGLISNRLMFGPITLSCREK